MVKRRRWLRFSLGSILLLISAVAIWLGVWSNKARNQRLAADALARAGYTLEFDFVEDAQQPNIVPIQSRTSPFPTLRRSTPPGNQPSEGEDKRRKLIRRYLGLHYADKLTGFYSSNEPVVGATPPTPTEWKRISLLQSIRKVRLGEGATDEALQNVCRITGLVELTLDSTEFTEKGFAALEHLENLRTLSIAKIADGERISGLRGLRSLQVLTLDNVIVLDNIDAANLSNSTELRKISQAMFRLNDEGVRNISQLVHLRELDLSFNAITDEGLKSVSGMKELERFEVAGTAVTDDGLQHIADLPNLDYLNLVSSKVTHKAVMQLRDRYPDRDIAHWPKPKSSGQ